MKKSKVISLAVPRYKELTVKKIWEMVKDVSEINCYFPDYIDEELPERDYLIAIISTINTEATKVIVSEAREQRWILTSDNLDNLVKITTEFKDEIRQINPQKSKCRVSLSCLYNDTISDPYSLKRNLKLFIEIQGKAPSTEAGTETAWISPGEA